VLLAAPAQDGSAKTWLCRWLFRTTTAAAAAASTVVSAHHHAVLLAAPALPGCHFLK
jgi:hypothetical protein